MAHDDFVQVFQFQPDASKAGRSLSSIKVGGVYVTRLEIAPKVITGNYYHKKTKLLFYVMQGTVLAEFQQVNTGKKRRIGLGYGKRLIHVPPYVAMATKNTGSTPAVLLFLSNKPIRSNDDSFPFGVMEE